jgi:CubicO group peptidase (beta-lactamase class C family)
MMSAARHGPTVGVDNGRPERSSAATKPLRDRRASIWRSVEPRQRSAVTIQATSLASRLDALARTHRVPGASLAVFVDGEVLTAATGVVNVETGVEATPDAVFQLGSISKVYTATAAMRLVEQGKLDLDAPVVDVLPEFRVADADTTARVTPRHLLSHTSGIAGDFFADTGRGDDALERYVESCGEIGQDVPLGATMSYCNTGFSILGRIIEKLSDRVWDDAMRELVYEPFGLRQTLTLPENALRFRTAMGHYSQPDGSPGLADEWDMPRATGPAGSICATARDLIAFARVHLDDGVALDASRALSAASVADMQRAQVQVPDRFGLADQWGLGWILWEVDGRTIFGHDGNGSGQNAFLRVVPDRRVAIGVLTNGGDETELGPVLLEELLRELCDIELPRPPRPQPGALDGAANVGAYERFGVRFDLERGAGSLRGTLRLVEPLASQRPDLPPQELELLPSDAGDGVYVTRIGEGAERWTPMAFVDIGADSYVHFGGRAMRKVA